MNEQEVIEAVLNDAIRFGAAIGSWHDSKISWHNMAAGSCIKAIKEMAAYEIKHKIKEIEEKRCHVCGQIKSVDNNPDN